MEKTVRELVIHGKSVVEKPTLHIRVTRGRRWYTICGSKATDLITVILLNKDELPNWKRCKTCGGIQEFTAVIEGKTPANDPDFDEESW